MRRTTCVAIVGFVLGCASHATAQSDFQWHGQLASGQTIEIKGINGKVEATRASGVETEVTATRSARRSNPSDVRLEVVPHPGGVTICAVYPNVPGREPNACDPGPKSRSHTKDNDTVVHFTVRVPIGVGFIGRTVNGNVEADALQGNAEGYTVNGSVRLSTTGAALASTVNGSITASMGRADWPDHASFSTVNGSITLEMPPALNADLNAETVNGNIESEFQTTAIGILNRRRLHGTIGNGGQTLDLKTVNGSIKLRKAQ